MRTLVFPVALAALMTACRASAAAPSLNPVEAERADVFRLATGSWDRAQGDSTCLGNTHTISFTPDGREMLLTFRQPIDSVTGQRVVRYNVLQAGSTVLPDLPVVIRSAMDGETRRTAGGALVVWDLIMASPNRYHWHRTDWPGIAITGAMVRCDGTRALEQWQLPAGGTTGE